MVLADSVLFKVRSNEEGATWQCALLRADAPAVDTSLLKACTPGADGSIEYTGLRDGSSYTFAIRATDAFENASPVATRRWLVDASPPRVYGASAWPEATRVASTALTFGVSDGPAGTGVASVECGVRWLGKAPQTEPDWAPCTSDNSTAATTSTQQAGSSSGGSSVQQHERLRAATPASAECSTGCIRFEQHLNTTQQGVWGFTVRTADKANQTYTSKEATVVVDRVAPEATWSKTGQPRTPSPPVVSVPLVVTNKGAYKSRIRGTLCALAPPHARLNAAFHRQASASVLLPAEERAQLASGARRADFELKAPDGAGVMAGTFAHWHVCTSPINLTRVPSGTFELHAKPLDAAGNAGAMLPPLRLVIDATLNPDDPIGLGAQRRGLSAVAIAAIAACAGALAIAAVVVAVLAARRRAAAQRASAVRRAAAAGLHVPAGTEWQELSCMRGSPAQRSGRIPAYGHDTHMAAAQHHCEVGRDAHALQSRHKYRHRSAKCSTHNDSRQVCGDRRASSNCHEGGADGGSNCDELDDDVVKRAVDAARLEVAQAASWRQLREEEELKLAIQASLQSI